MFFCNCRKDEDSSQTLTAGSSILPTVEYESPRISRSSYEPRLSIIHGLPSNEPLESLAQANEAVLARDALSACRKISDLCQQKELSSLWFREQVAQCLARACLVLGDVFPLKSKFPPTETLFSLIPIEEQIIVAVISADNIRNQLFSDGEEYVDGLESFPITFYRSQPNYPCTKELHAEMVMISQSPSLDNGIYHLQDTHTVSHVSSASSLSSTNRKQLKNVGKTYFAKRLHDRVVAIVYFPRTLREQNDYAVMNFFLQLQRLFVLF